jgi:hypothetical protein
VEISEKGKQRNKSRACMGYAGEEKWHYAFIKGDREKGQKIAKEKRCKVCYGMGVLH